LLRAVNTAKDRQEEATYRLQQAILAEADAVKKLREEYKELASAAEAAGKTFNIPKIPDPVSFNGGGGGGGGGNGNGATVVVNVTAGIGGNAYQVGKEIIEVLDQYTSVAGPLDTLMRVA
jgi:hypothetical protein